MTFPTHQPVHQRDILSNPIWHSLTTEHRHFFIGNDLACRYPAEVSPLAALASHAEDAYHALAEIVSLQESVFVFLLQPPSPPSNWQIKVALTIDQMVCEHFTPPAGCNPLIAPLSDEDIPEMLSLVSLTKPGPFGPRTKEMGRYVGIRQNQQLAAMSGERLHLTGYTEVSAVCTHPDYRGRGFAKDLVAAVAQGITERGEIPFLHVKSDNHSAIGLYERLGFQKSRLIHFAILCRTA